MLFCFSYVVHGGLQDENGECNLKPTIKHGFKAPSLWSDPSKFYFSLYDLSQGLPCAAEIETVKAAQISGPKTHLTHVMPTIAKEIPVLRQMLQTLIASLPAGTGTEI